MQTNVQRSSSCLFQRAKHVVLPRLTLFRRERRVSRNSHADRHGRQFSIIGKARAISERSTLKSGIYSLVSDTHDLQVGCQDHPSRD